MRKKAKMRTGHIFIPDIHPHKCPLYSFFFLWNGLSLFYLAWIFNFSFEFQSWATTTQLVLTQSDGISCRWPRRCCFDRSLCCYHRFKGRLRSTKPQEKCPQHDDGASCIAGTEHQKYRKQRLRRERQRREESRYHPRKYWLWWSGKCRCWWLMGFPFHRSDQFHELIQICPSYLIKQIEFLRRHQHISTIDTSSPNRLLLATSNSGSFIPSSTIQIHKNQNAMGYCTLRNGSLHHSQSPMNMGVSNIGVINPNSNVFHNPSNTCTLPRHPNNHWPSYGGTIAGVRNVSQTITISGGPQPNQNSNQLLAMHTLGPARTRCMGLAEDDSEIPLMAKRDSTVWL